MSTGPPPGVIARRNSRARSRSSRRGLARSSFPPPLPPGPAPPAPPTPRRGLLCPARVRTGVDLPVLARYPFLREASGYIRAEGISLEELLTDPAYARARALGRGRVLAAL